MKKAQPAFRVLIADDHSMVRQGIKVVINSLDGWELCGEAANGRQAVELAKELQPDVAVLDITMPELNGLDATRQIGECSPRTKVIILTMHESDALALTVIKAGARGFVLKNDAPEALPRALTAVREGRIFFTPKVSDLVMLSLTNPAAMTQLEEAPRSRLTPREREIVQLLAEGFSNKEAADRLGISHSTIESHRKNVMSKLKLRSSTELVRYAIRNNLIQA